MIPHLAGATRLPYRSIAPYSLIAAPLWDGVESTAGYAAADWLRRLIAYGAPVLAVTAFLIAAAALIGITLRCRTRTREASRAPLVVPPHTADVATPVTSHEYPLRTSKTRA